MAAFYPTFTALCCRRRLVKAKERGKLGPHLRNSRISTPLMYSDSTPFDYMKIVVSFEYDCYEVCMGIFFDCCNAILFSKG
ncbi:hypothetical protein SASPL_100040 [Salvia splendens]|uniref:Uncharacterized protein n=1 Tax=Salvia splendens TaxID=180675 RepID=A0A8X8YS50_SALSN|nr:hypothetical protein SASPL_100040 [Salvia splendens]